MRTVIAVTILGVATFAAFQAIRTRTDALAVPAALFTTAGSGNSVSADRPHSTDLTRTVDSAPATREPPAAPSMAATLVTPVAAPAAPPAPACDNPNALGVSRVVEIDTAGGPGFGFEHFKGYDFLKPGEVVLTFDDGPWLHSTPLVLEALADHCTKALFFAIGKHATYYPEILRQVAAAGHTIGSHTWSHQDLANKKKVKTPDEAKEEIEKGISAVKWALAGSGTQSPFFRFPTLRSPPEMVTYLGERNIAMFSTDLDSFDFKLRKPDQVVKSVMDKLKKHGKGIVLMHDFHINTARALPALLDQLKAGGYKIVQIKAKAPVQSLAQYDDMIATSLSVPTMAAGRPMSSVVKTIGQ